MFAIVNKQMLAPGVKRLDIRAEAIAKAVRPGQFVIIIPKPMGKGIPLAVADADRSKGTIIIIFKEIGSGTQDLGRLAINDTVYSVSGPFGTAVKIERLGTVVCAASGIGTAQILPVCRALRESGNKIIGIIGARNRREIMLEPQMRLACHKLVLATRDGLYERRSSIREVITSLIPKEKIALVYAIGDVAMMEDVATLTRQQGIPARVQVNPLILCGRGVCGSCRVKLAGKTVLTCQHGPEFDAHQLDFSSVRLRLRAAEKEDEPVAADPSQEIINKFFPGLLRKS